MYTVDEIDFVTLSTAFDNVIVAGATAIAITTITVN